MDQTIDSVNKPSPEALYQNWYNRIIEMFESNTKLDQNGIIYMFEYALKKFNRGRRAKNQAVLFLETHIL